MCRTASWIRAFSQRHRVAEADEGGTMSAAIADLFSGPAKESNGDGPSAYVYFIGDGEFVKIGVARDPWHRLRDLQTAHPKPLRLISGIPCEIERRAYHIESELHKRFAGKRASGEWFRLDTTDIPESVSADELPPPKGRIETGLPVKSCRHCGALFTQAKRGRARHFCDTKCRVRAHRSNLKNLHVV